MILQDEVSSLWAARRTFLKRWNQETTHPQVEKISDTKRTGEETLSWHLSKQPQTQCLETVNISLGEAEPRSRFAGWFWFRVSFEVAIKDVSWDCRGLKAQMAEAQLPRSSQGRWKASGHFCGCLHKALCMATVSTQSEWAQREHSVQEPLSFYNRILKWHPSLCHILFIRHEWICPAHTQGKRIRWKHEYILWNTHHWDHLRSCLRRT